MIIKKQKLINRDIANIAYVLRNGGIAVLPTDTIYGLHTTIKSKTVVEKIYKLKGREEKKPFIVLINSIQDIENLGIKIEEKIKDFLKKVWPGKVSIIFEIKGDKYSHLHRGTNSLAFRMPKNKLLKEIISKAGPIISTSVNKVGLDPSRNIKEANRYFGENINIYVDDGNKRSSSSTLIKIYGKEVVILRQGSVKIDKLII